MKRRRFLAALSAGMMGFQAHAMSRMMGMHEGEAMPGAMGGMMRSRVHTSSLPPITGQPLLIPPLYEGAVRQGVRHYDLAITPGEHEVVQDAITNTWAVQMPGSDLPMLGPTLRLRRGEQVSINYRNGLDEATTMHGHGLVVPGSADGGPHQRIPVKGAWSARFTVDQPAATCWYHPHELGKTAEQVYKGLAGFIFIEDDEQASLEFPNTYGVDDIPLVVQDRVVDVNGQFSYQPSMHEIRMGYFGNVILTNGRASPVFEAGRGLLRLRLLNGANSEVWRFSFGDRRAFAVIAGDNGLLSTPAWIKALRLSPGERAEIVVDLRHDAGQKVLLWVDGLRSRQQKRVLTIKVKEQSAPIAQLPDRLSQPWQRPDLKGLRQRHFQLGSMMFLTINGKSMDMDVINERVPLGQAELWRVRTGMGMMVHNFHIHGGGFRVLARNGRADRVWPHEQCEKDTVYLAPGDEVLLWIRFRKPADTDNPYMYHCHFLEHEDAGMMGQFTVDI